MRKRSGQVHSRESSATLQLTVSLLYLRKIKRLLMISKTSKIVSKIISKTKETFRKNYIKPAIELGLIKMTLPEKPNSKNQRYVKQ